MRWGHSGVEPGRALLNSLPAARCPCQVVRKSATDELQWDVSSMYGVKEEPFFVKSELLAHEADQVGARAEVLLAGGLCQQVP